MIEPVAAHPRSACRAAPADETPARRRSLPAARSSPPPRGPSPAPDPIRLPTGPPRDAVHRLRPRRRGPVPITRFGGRLYRQTALGVPACAPPLQPAPHPGRYHRAGDPWPLYAALDEPTIWAEWQHATGGAVQPDDDPRWRCIFDAELDPLDLLDLRDPATRRALGVTLESLRASWSPTAPNDDCLAVTSAAAEMGLDGIIVPSAAAPDGWSIDVLPPAFGKLRLVARDRVIPAPPGPPATPPTAEPAPPSRPATTRPHITR
jgi:RES domain-containing protein